METGCVYTITRHIRPPDDKPAAREGSGVHGLICLAERRRGSGVACGGRWGTQSSVRAGDHGDHGVLRRVGGGLGEQEPRRFAEEERWLGEGRRLDQGTPLPRGVGRRPVFGGQVRGSSH